MDITYDDDIDAPLLPGFRFYPTDEELLGFYLKRKVQNIPFTMELIKQADIYKFNPWDLPKEASIIGDNKEWYFYCKRGRKYKNSARPNRVTGSGFWKATGIDKPIYDHQGGRRECIVGLKKSLVFYRGSAGKGTKTDWMMHEFRLPDHHNNIAKTNTPEATEVWTLCRIFKRDISCRKYTSNWREISISTKQEQKTSSSKSCTLESTTPERCTYISFTTSEPIVEIPSKKQFSTGQLIMNSTYQSLPFVAASSSSSSFSNMDQWKNNDQFFTTCDNNNWDELSSVFGFSCISPTTI